MLTPRQAQSPEAKYALTIFRAAALSRKQPATVKQLLRDYTELEGHGVNYRKFGYEHLDDFLVQSGEFIIHNMQGEMYLTARPSPETDHIRKMMRNQKKPKKQAMLKFREPTKSDQSWNKSSYSSNVYQKLPSPRKLPKHSSEKNNNVQRKSGDSNNNSNESNRNAAQKAKNNSSMNALSAVSKSQQLQQQQQQQKQQHQQPKAKSTSINTSNLTALNLQDRLKQSQQQIAKDSNKTQQQQQQQKVPNNTQNGEKQLQQGGKSSSMNQQQQNQQRLTATTNNSANTQQQQLQRERRFSEESIQRISPIFKPIGKGSIQDRLKIAQQQQLQQKQQSEQQSNMLRRNSANDDIQRFSPSNSPNSLVRSNSNSVIVNEPEKTKIIIEKQIKNTTINIPATTTTFSYLESPPITNTLPPLVFEFNPDLDAISSLAQYCAVRRFEQPVYKFLKSRFSSKIHGRVIINGATYSTYPDEFDIEVLAKVAAAAKAIDEIKIQEARNRYPICTDSDSEIALKIYEEVKQHTSGIFHKKVPEIFEYKYQKILPDNWFSIIQESNMFTVEITLGDNMIILAKEETAGSSAASVNSDSLDSDVIVIDRILLPWESKYWNLYITYCASTIEIWARIVDKGYNDKLDALMNDIDVYMLTDKQRPNSIICGQIYLISISECWHRVRVEEMNKENGKCLCFFIDFGDEEWQSMEQLYVCETNFLRLPPQAICFSLFGLEDFAENPNAKKHLDTLTGRPLVAEILTKRETFENDNDDTINSGGSMNHLNITKIQCVLYDTSTNEDVNLNPLILNQICDDTQPPQLKRNAVNNVYITHVHKNGELYLQIRNMELQYVQKLVQQLVESKFKKDQHKVSIEDMKTTKLFFIQDLDDGRWYRGALATEQNDGDTVLLSGSSVGGSGCGANGRIRNSDETYNIYYVDYGVVKLIPLSRIYRLDSLSAALSKFPRQAIKVRLHKLPPINEKIIGLIRGLLPNETPAIVKIAVNAIIPQVIVYKRFEDKGGLFNVNESIQIEYELESSNEISDTQSTATASALTNAVGKVDRESPIQSHTTFDTTGTGLGPHSPINSMRTLSLRTQITVPNSPQKYLPKLLENIFIPAVGEHFDVIVTMASNPSNFTVRPYNDGPKLSEMMEELKVYCSSNDEFIPIDMIEEGQAYAAYNPDGYYYRVTVENIFKSMEIHVHFCDFGGVDILSNDKLKTLPARFRTLPKQAISAKLSGIKPIHGDWTFQDCFRFQQLTVKQKFVSIIQKISDDPVTPGTRLLELKLVDVQTDEDICIGEIMINEKRAIKC